MRKLCLYEKEILVKEQVNSSGGKRKRKVIRKQKNKVQETNKLKRVQGVEYVSLSGKKVSSKTFNLVTDCCQKKCHDNLPLDFQVELFDCFYNCQNKSLQDSQLSNCIDLAKDPESRRNVPEES
ncbi:hypothetical protein J6590_021670 [Homalodisca vitripennis]|nr:hypothetical protein J6590_021670 [Homalodisca vitripennis]